MGNRLYVGNLSFNTTETQLRDLFGRDGGQVNDVHLVVDRDTGRSRGFGFVEMANAAQATTAITTFHGATLEGRTLTVNEAREREGGRSSSRRG